MAGIGEDRDKLNSGKGLSGILNGLADLVETLGKLEKDGLVEINERGQLGKKNIRGVYNYSVRMGLGGAPETDTPARDSNEKKPAEEEIREPIVDIIPEEDHLLIIAEMPGVEESDVDIRFGEESVFITADGKNNGRKYRKEITVEGLEKPVKYTSHYHNGIMKIKIMKN